MTKAGERLFEAAREMRAMTRPKTYIDGLRDGLRIADREAWMLAVRNPDEPALALADMLTNTVIAKISALDVLDQAEPQEPKS